MYVWRSDSQVYSDWWVSGMDWSMGCERLAILGLNALNTGLSGAREIYYYLCVLLLTLEKRRTNCDT